MKILTALTALLVLAGGALAARAAFQETPKPGPEHAILKHMAGTWDAATPDKGTKTAELGMNGLWLTSDFEGSMMGMPFLGHDVLGWDPQKKKYVSCWVDSVTPALTLMEGTWDEATKALTMTSLAPDPMTGQPFVGVTKVQDADHHTWTMHPGTADAPAMMTITYTRKK